MPISPDSNNSTPKTGPTDPGSEGMVTFVDRMEAWVRQHPEEQWSELTVLLPNSRAALFLKRALEVDVPIGTWLPNITTLGDWASHRTGLKSIPGLEQLVELYDVAKGFPTDCGLPEWSGFDAFAAWGQCALGDFNAMENYWGHKGLTPELVFTNPRQIKDIESWSFNSTELTEDQQRFLAQWDMLAPLMDAFTQRLGTRGAALPGRILRTCLNQGFTAQSQGVLIGGFNAMTPAESKLLDALRKAGATVLWDSDRSIVDSVEVGAEFVRKHASTEEKRAIPDQMRYGERSLRAVRCSARSSQAQYVRQELEKRIAEAQAQGNGPIDFSRTAIILPKADLVPQLLLSLPEGLGAVNVTMGVPLRLTPIADFLYLALTLADDAPRFRHDVLRSFLSHPVTRTFYPSVAKEEPRWMGKVSRNYIFRIGAADLEETPGILRAMQPWLDLRTTTTARQAQFIAALCDWVPGQTLENLDDAWLESAWSGLQDVLALHLRQQEYAQENLDWRGLRARLSRMLGQANIDLAGVPIEGLQIMGLLESRGLDFDEVFVLDVNEGTLPKGEAPPTFLPMDLRRNWDLPGRSDRDQLYGSHLIRLLHTAHTVHWVHVDDELGDAQASRFIRVVDAWANRHLPNLIVEHLMISTDAPTAPPSTPPLHWNDDMRKAWQTLVFGANEGKGLSPSALNTLLACPRHFHYKYMLKMGEPLEVEETMKASTSGSIAHAVMEDLLKPIVGRALQVQDLTEALKNLEQRVATAFFDAEAKRVRYPKEATDQGENYLLLQQLTAVVRKWIEDERREIKHAGGGPTLLGVEEKFSQHVGDIDGRPILLRGIVDRVERPLGDAKTVHVIDYKSGRVDKADVKLKPEDWAEQLSGGKKEKAVQLLIYAVMAKHKYSDANDIRSSIRPGKSDAPGTLPLIGGESPGGKTAPWSAADSFGPFIDWLGATLKAAGSAEHVVHNPDASYCDYCLALD